MVHTQLVKEIQMSTTAHLGPHFVKRDWTDHQLAAFLRSKGAIDNCLRMGRSNVWRDANGNIVAQVTYSGIGGLDTTIRTV